MKNKTYTKKVANSLEKRTHHGEGKEGIRKALGFIGVQTVDFCEHFTRMFRIQILTMDGNLILHNAQK